MGTMMNQLDTWMYPISKGLVYFNASQKTESAIKSDSSVRIFPSKQPIQRQKESRKMKI